MIRRLGAVLLAGLAACDLVVAPGLPPGAVPFDPPARYRLWWDMVQACSGRTGELRGVRWLHVPGATELPARGEQLGSVTGTWYRHENTIVLAGASVLLGPEVRHEMLHALVREPGHSREEFQERCGGIVSCSIACRYDGGGAVGAPADAPTVRAGSMHVRTQVRPVVGVFATDSGAVAIVVTATNPSERPAWVSLDGRAFTVRVDRRDVPDTSYGAAPADAARMGFDGLGERRYAFDFVLPPGSYTARGFFGGTAAPPVDFDVAP